MRYSNGWIKLHRSIRKKELYQDSRLILLVVELLLISNYEKSNVLLKTGLRELLPGQTLISMRKLSVTLGIPHATVERLLNKLEMYEFLRQEVVQRGTIITICNWEIYQAKEEELETDSVTNLRQERDTLETHLRHQKELKKLRNQETKKEESSSGTIAASPDGADCDPNSDRPRDPPEKPKRTRKPKLISDGSRVWNSYAAAYEKRWSTAPVRNAKANKMCSLLVQHLGADEAPLVAEFYVSHHDKFIVQQLHPLSLLVNQHQRFRTEWIAGQQMTSTFASQIDKTKATNDVFSRALQRWSANEKTTEQELRNEK